ncbi:uncharacterized protein LOC117342751 [Pecten maximus]|uniref:uncharacterized protein LOC117342751 n=1 Tax=Pecten maximus TaxID=6579 RepID=UPI00145906BA|nr:uncharacterized protein LOC117342751 [Pecten maximus]XP_033760880.1 uncharacterized protein LOC117342751 [Pecten maximus]
MTIIEIPSESTYDEIGRTTYWESRRSPSASTNTSETCGSNISLPQLTSRKSINRQDKILTIVSIFLATSCVFLAIFVALLFTKLEKVRGELGDFANTTTNRKICVRCAQLNSSRLGPNGIADLESLDVALDDDGEEVCCAGNARQTNSLLEIVYINSEPTCMKGLQNSSETRCNSSAASLITTGTSAAAHLLAGLQNNALQYDTDTVPVRNWRSDDLTSHLEGVKLTNDRLVIKNTGLYMVYSQIYFSKYVALTALKSATLLYHLVYRYNTIYPNGGNQVLMQSVKTMIFDPKMTHSDLTSFTAAAIELVAGDQIYVKVSNISLMSGDEKASFLGVVKFE